MKEIKDSNTWEDILFYELDELILVIVSIIQIDLQIQFSPYQNSNDSLQKMEKQA
jgi:hypothetical protein